MLSKNDVCYKAYVLRLWSDGDHCPWRAALKCARTGTRHSFANLADLVTFLESETGSTLLKVSLTDAIAEDAYGLAEEIEEGGAE
jgi:hypothetical protein